MMLDKAVAFLQREIKEEVARAKREKHTIYIGTAHLNYLYIRALLNQPADETTRLLTKLALKQAPTATMDFKALLAVVLQKTGNKKEAKTLRESEAVPLCRRESSSISLTSRDRRMVSRRTTS